MKPTFAYCAARYLDVWVRKESSLAQGMRAPTPASIRASLAHFNVSRGFAEIDNDQLCNKVATRLIEHDKYVTPKTAATRVIDFAATLTADFGYDNLLSAASKLLWLRSRSPFIIFDNRAADALELEGNEFKRRDYASYCQAWKTAYSENQNAISEALKKLPRFIEFTAAAHLGSPSLVELVSQDWFAERTFDQYLWLIGAPKKSIQKGAA